MDRSERPASCNGSGPIACHVSNWLKGAYYALGLQRPYRVDRYDFLLLVRPDRRARILVASPVSRLDGAARTLVEHQMVDLGRLTRQGAAAHKR